MGLDSKTFDEIIELALPSMQTEGERQAWLTRLFPTAAARPSIDLSGDPRQATTRLISELAEYGDIRPNESALVAFLNVLRTEVGIEKQAQIDSIIVKITAKANTGVGKRRGFKVSDAIVAAIITAVAAIIVALITSNQQIVLVLPTATPTPSLSPSDTPSDMAVSPTNAPTTVTTQAPTNAPTEASLAPIPTTQAPTTPTESTISVHRRRNAVAVCAVSAMDLSRLRVRFGNNESYLLGDEFSTSRQTEADACWCMAQRGQTSQAVAESSCADTKMYTEIGSEWQNADLTFAWNGAALSDDCRRDETRCVIELP